MLSRNNWKEQVRQQEPKKQRFTIKKLTIGVASVLLGFTFMGMSASANTQTIPGNPAANTNTNANASSTEEQSDNAASQSVQPDESGATGDANPSAASPAYVRINAQTPDNTRDSEKYQVHYPTMNIERPTTDTPVTKTEMPIADTMPDGTITGYKLTGDTHGAPFNPPKGVTASVDSKTGKLTVTVAKDATTDPFNIIVDIDYQDGSGTFWNVPVNIYDHTETSVQISWSSVSPIVNLHRTTDDNTNIDVNNSRINTINIDYDWGHTSGNGNYRKTTVYKLNADGTKFVNTTDPTDSFDASAFKYEWRKGPNTKFGTGTDTGTVLGWINDRYNTEENYSMKYTVTDPSVAEKLDLKPNYSSFTRVYFNFWGATTGQTLTFKQNQDISNLNQAQYRQLINVTDLGANGWNGKNVDPSTPQEAAYTPGTDATKTFSMAWAPNGQPSTATVADGVKGTVRINFNDGTYLDVPATINVVKNNADTTTLIAPSKIVPSYDGTKVVDTPFYNNPQGTNSKLIDNESKDGQYNIYFTAKDASGKEYASSYAAEKNEPKGVVLNSILDKDAGAYDPNSLELHFYYQNNSDKDQTINYTLRMPDYLNPYKAGRPESSLVPDGSRISDVKVTSKQGNTYDISSLTKTLDGVKSRDGDLRYVGEVPVNLTVKANDAIDLVIPFVLNTTAKKSNTTIDDHNEFMIFKNGQRTGYLVVRSSTYAPLYSEDKIYPLVNVGNNNYTHDYPDNPGAFTLDPSVYRDEDFMNGFWERNIYNYSTPTNKSTVYGSYTSSYLLLDNYEDYLTKHGFSVTFSNGKPVPYYMYQLSKTGSKVVDKNGNPVQGETKGHPYFEVVPVILLNQDETYTTKTAPTAWDPSTMVNKVADPTNYRYWDQKTDSAVRMDNTVTQLTAKDFTVTITKDGQAVKPDANGKYDLSKPGTYTVTYSRDFNGTTISNSGKITVTTVKEPDNPFHNNNTPTPTEDTTVTYTFYDETDKKPVEGHDVTVAGQPGTDQKVNLTTPEGYKLAEGQTLPTSVTMPKANKTITINLVHATKDIKPNDPGVNPSDPAYADMFKTVTRTIKVNTPDRMVDTTTQQVNFNRTKIIDEVTDEVISYGNWTLATGSAKDWGQFNVPQLDGFISYVDGNAAKEVAEENVTADTADVTVEVTYKNSGNNGNNTTPDDDGNHNTNPGDNGNHNTNPGNNGNNNGINNGTQNGNGNKTVNTNVTDNSNGDNGQNNKQALPQTGNTKNDAAVAGLGLAGLLAMLGLGGLKKKRN